MTTLDKKSVTDTLSKLPKELINILLVASDKNCVLAALDDANNSKKALKINREKLVQSIIEFDDLDTYNRAKEHADSLATIDDSVEVIQEELKPIEVQYKEKKAQIKQLKEEKQALINLKAKELEEILSAENLEKITQYKSDVEKARAELLRQKQREKGLKAYAEGLMVSIIDDLEKEYVTASEKVEDFTTENAEKFCKKIKEDKKINLDTLEGMKLVNKTFSKAIKIPLVNAINQSQLDLEFKNNTVMSCLSTKATKSVQQKVSVGV